VFQDYGHRVRLATHANFKEFVLTAGLEFYPLGGDPKILAECMPLLLFHLNGCFPGFQNYEYLCARHIHNLSRHGEE
jgi:hypothetical protein